MKKKFGESIGLPVKIIGQGESDQMTTTQEIIAEINQRNQDEDCIGIMTQLPLPANLLPDTNHINAMIDPYKDIDGL
jgi:methylenetetrahydrofolate dehydrogenase (NADP+)/methenyltetrahydrofolate cyclohydrolase